MVKPGGTVATYMWDMQGGGFPMYPILVEMRAMGVLPPRPPQVDASRMEVLRGLWADSGLEAMEAREITVYRTFPSFDDFWRIKMTAPTLGPTVEAMAPVDAEALKARSQDLPTLYCPTGAVWWSTAGALRREGTFYMADHTGWELPWGRAVDIDDEDDWQLAELLIGAAGPS